MRLTACVHVYVMLGAKWLELLLARVWGLTRDPVLGTVACSGWLACTGAYRQPDWIAPGIVQTYFLKCSYRMNALEATKTVYIQASHFFPHLTKKCGA